MPSRRTTVGALSILGVSGLVASLSLGTANASPTVSHRAAAPKVTVAKPSLVKGGKVIVVLKDQHTTTQVSGTTHVPAAVAQASRSNVASVIRNAGGTVHTNLSIVNAVSATMTTEQATAVAQRSDVAEVIPDAIIRESDPAAATPQATTPTPQPAAPPVAGACPTNPSDVQLGPEALADTHADSSVAGAKTARSLGYDGTGVTVAYMAEGIDINNPDFMRDGKSIFTHYADFSTDGPDAPTTGGEAFLDAGSIAAQGNVVYNLRNYSERPFDRDCNIRLEGEAPGVDLVGIKVFSNNGATTTSNFLQGIQYAVAQHVDVLNESFGSDDIPDTSQDVTKAADDAAVAAGTTVTVSTGDAGVTNTIGSPASDPKVIAVGASTTYQTYLQTGSSPRPVNGWKSDNISGLSSAGFNPTGGSVTLVAPGDSTFEPCTADVTMYSDCTNSTGAASNIVSVAGTSESAPTVAGVAALVIQAYREGHGNASPTPGEIRQILTATADDIDAPAEQQGAGLVDAYKAVQLAKAYGTHGTPTATALQNTSVRFNAVAAPKTAETFTDTLINRGTTTQTITTRTRKLGPYQTVATAKPVLSDKNSPKYVSGGGTDVNSETVSFTVPAGKARLSASIAYETAQTASSPDNLILVDPDGDLVAESFPIGFGNYAHVEVASPVAGTWTAYVVSPESSEGGSEGTVRFEAAVAGYRSFGTVSPATLTLAPGQSGKVTMHVATMATPGDLAASLMLSSNAPGTTGAAHTNTTVPVTLRSVIPSGSQKFEQTLTGGNGGSGVEYHYAINVGKNVPELNATVRLNLNPNNQFQAVLVAPNQNVAAFAANITQTTSPVGGTFQALVKGVQLHTLDPAPGLWTLTVVFAPAVSGTSVSTPFTVTTDNLARVASAAGLPTSKKTVLKGGTTERYYVRIKNTGPSPETYFVDARRDRQVTYDLAAFTGPFATAPITGNVPEYVVPSHTTKIGAAAATDGTAPIQFDMSSPLGDPDIGSGTGTSVTAFYGANQVTPGEWAVIPDQVGPYATAPDPEDVATQMVALTNEFDPAVTSSTGDVWLTSLDPNTTVNTVTVNPGDTAVIQVKMTPAKGAHTVSGTLYIDDANLTATYSDTAPFPAANANEVAAIPYAYAVK